jgi:hypothetical protein
MEKNLDPQLEQALRQAHLIAVYQDMLGRIEGIGDRISPFGKGSTKATEASPAMS